MEHPDASRVFEHFGINYCCNGRKPLAEACEDLSLSTEAVLDDLSAQEKSSASGSDMEMFPFDPHTAPLIRIIQHIVRRYHWTARHDIPRIHTLAEKVRIRHGASHPEVIEVEKAFFDLSTDLEYYMHEEEQSLFPAITGRHYADGLSISIHRMEAEHQAYGEKLQFLRMLTANYSPPPDACLTYRALYEVLEHFASDIHEHVHLENNILFPRALREQLAVWK
jgi:regulator of cell morphogenesis and NO signaling